MLIFFKGLTVNRVKRYSFNKTAVTVTHNKLVICFL